MVGILIAQRRTLFHQSSKFKRNMNPNFFKGFGALEKETLIKKRMEGGKRKGKR